MKTPFPLITSIQEYLAVERALPTFTVQSRLALPVVNAAIPDRFTTHGESDPLKRVAETLVDAGILKLAHWQENDLRKTVAHAFTALAQEHLPDPLAKFSLLVVENTSAADLEYNNGDGVRMTDKAPLNHSALVVTFDTEQLCHRVIGPAILKLEAQREGLGQTVLYWLHTAFDRSAHALDPVAAFGWAQYNYWGGEPDEKMRFQEELDSLAHFHGAEQNELPAAERKPFDADEAASGIEIFRKSDYDRDIPPWAGSAFVKRPKISLDQLRQSGTRFPLPDDLKKIFEAVIAVADVLKRQPATLCDTNNFERCRTEMSPYLLRWECVAARGGNISKQDCLARIYDDYMNCAAETGEEMLDVNAVFAWRDDKSLVGALKRFTQWLRRLRAAENLLRALAPDAL
jgi:PRTRC genetic system protein F